MMISSLRRSKGYTLLEILLAIGVGVILTFVAVPSMAGWWSEHRMRMQANDLIDLVQSAKIAAEKAGRRQLVILDAREPAPRTAKAGIHYFAPDNAYNWEFYRFDGGLDDRPQPSIAIDSRGRVEPVSFRIRKGDRFIEYRFDFLTGHVREGGFSL